jgi:hypothetical protein
VQDQAKQLLLLFEIYDKFIVRAWGLRDRINSQGRPIWGLQMADCERINLCVFFKDVMADRPATGRLIEKQYCRNSEAECARFMVLKAVGKEHVPNDLYPNSFDRANEIISSMGNS